jgi:hypothetical protein
MSWAVILPVSECTLIFFMSSLSRFAITKFSRMSFGGRFLAWPLWRLARVRSRARDPGRGLATLVAGSRPWAGL